MADSKLDFTQILPLLYDQEKNHIRVGAEVTASIAGAQEVVINHEDDSIKVGDGDNFLTVNADGSINVRFSEGDLKIIRSFYSQASGIESDTEVSVLSYTVPSGKSFYLQRINVAGDNKAEYKVKVNNQTMDRKFTSLLQFNETFDFHSGTEAGLMFNAGTTITVTAKHSNSGTGIFNVRLQGAEE